MMMHLLPKMTMALQAQLGSSTVSAPEKKLCCSSWHFALNAAKMVQSVSTAQQAATRLQAALAALHALPLAQHAWQDCGQASYPATFDWPQTLGKQAHACLHFWASTPPCLAKFTRASSPPPSSAEERAAAVASALQLHAASCRFLHWLAGLSASQPAWLWLMLPYEPKQLPLLFFQCNSVLLTGSKHLCIAAEHIPSALLTPSTLSPVLNLARIRVSIGCYRCSLMRGVVRCGAVQYVAAAAVPCRRCGSVPCWRCGAVHAQHSGAE